MGADEDDEPDLALVTTYVPVVLALMRTTGAVVVGEALVYVGVPMSVRLVVFSVALYLDASRVRVDRFERASGGLFLLALAMLMRWQLAWDAPDSCGALAGVAGSVLDTLWAVCASTWCALACLGMHASMSLHALVLGAGAFACGHVMVVCDVSGNGELLVRAYVYELMCAVMFFGKRYVPNVERNVYLRSVPFACAHVLLVSLYIVVPSMLICTCLYATLAYRNTQNSAQTAPPPPATQHYARPGKTPAVADEQLLMQLKAAKESQLA